MRRRPGPRATEFAWQSVLLTDEEWQAFEQFCRTTLHDGSLVFDMPVYRPGEGFVVRKCQLKDGLFSTDHSQIPWQIVSFTLIVYNW